MRDGRPGVLVVDDEPTLVKLYRAWLDDRYAVRSATGVDEALDELDLLGADESGTKNKNGDENENENGDENEYENAVEGIDAVVLDRRMPGRAGDELLAAIRERDLDLRVAMVSAVEPGLDLLDLAFDAYLVKPVVRDDLVEVVSELVARQRYDDRTTEYLALVSKWELLRRSVDPAEREASEAVDDLERRIVELRSAVDAGVVGGTGSDIETALRRATEGPDDPAESGHVGGDD